MKFIKGSDGRHHNIEMFVSLQRETYRDYDCPGANPTSTVIWGYLIKGEAVQIFRSSFLVEVDAFLVKHGIELLG
jgi:hypothetical protein